MKAMKVREYIELLESLPDNLKEHTVLIEWELPRTTQKSAIAAHYKVFFLESTTVSLLQEELATKPGAL